MGSAVVLYIWVYNTTEVVKMCEVVGVGLYWKLMGKIMGAVCEVVAGFLHGFVFIGSW